MRDWAGSGEASTNAWGFIAFCLGSPDGSCSLQEASETSVVNHS